MGYIRQACKDLGVDLPEVAPRGLYLSSIRSGGQIHLSGQVSRLENRVIKGPASNADVDRAHEAARVAALRALSVLDAALEKGERVRLVKLTGYIMTDDSFTEHSKALDGASELLTQVLGEHGRHARTAIGVRSLPSSGLVELDLSCNIEMSDT